MCILGFTPPHIDFPDDFEPVEETSEESETDDDSPKRTKARGGTSGNTIMGISALVVLLICVTIIACSKYTLPCLTFLPHLATVILLAKIEGPLYFEYAAISFCFIKKYQIGRKFEHYLKPPF